MALVKYFHRLVTSIRCNQLINVKKTNIQVSTYQDCKLNVFFKSFTSSTQPLCDSNKEVKVTFIRASGEQIEAKGKVGDNLLDIVVNNEIDLDGYGACEGTLTCSTCHLIFSKEVYDSLPDKPTDEELDMLDLAYDLTETSRLGCQITMTKELDGLKVHVPATINDARS